MFIRFRRAFMADRLLRFAAVLMLGPVMLCNLARAQTAAADLPFDEPLFDHQSIQNDPLNVEIVSEETRDGLILRKLTFDGGQRQNEADESETVHIEAMMVMPAEGDDLPGVLWCQGGMAPASFHMPRIYAKKGYACIAITLPHKLYPAFAAWDATNPKQANLTQYGHFQMRAVTVLTQEPRVDADRLAVAGASYGGFFSTLVAGADPRIKAGAAFFSAGRHDLGTNLPQFTGMPDKAAVDTWRRTIDPAWRHELRDMPFLWTLPTNDNWFHFPAVVETFRAARSPHKRLAIIPYWTHGFPPHIDQQIFDFFDVHLKQTREPYIQPAPLTIERTETGLRATWAGDPPQVVGSYVVVSPNAPGPDESPWTGQWVYRLHQPINAKRNDDGSGWADIPVLDPTRPMLVYRNVVDKLGVTTSTLPVLVSPPYPDGASVGDVTFNGAPWGELEPDEVAVLTALAQSPGESDTQVAYRGKGSAKTPATADAKAAIRPRTVKLFHVPHLAHRLEVAVRSAEPVTIEVSVQAHPPANWGRPAVAALMGDRPEPLAKPTAVAARTVSASPDWQLVTLDVPTPDVAIEGYNLQLRLAEPAEVDWWFDSIRFTPVAPAAPQ